MLPYIVCALTARKCEVIMNKVFENEMMMARSTFDAAALCDFLYSYAYKIVGVDRHGNTTTLKEEVAEVARMSHKAYVDDGVNYYRSRTAYIAAETDIQGNSSRMYIRAAKKLLFLNSKAKELMGKGFIAKKIYKESVSDMSALVDSFEFVVTHYDEFIGA